MHAFQVYIDESGDEGFTFRENGDGSSRWFVLSAAVTRVASDLETVRLVDAVRADLGKADRAELHFRNLKHQQRLPYLQRIAEARIRTVSVLIHKPSLEGDHFSTKGLLYNYATRLLLERVSWLCRDHRLAPEHRARLVFSNRANMSYAELHDYLQDLEARSRQLDVRVDWSAIDCSKLRVEPHAKLMGLQIADAVASSMWYGVNCDRHGFTEPRYANMLRPTVYAHRGTRFGYGLKVMPAELIRNGQPLPGTEWLQEGQW